MPAEPFSMPIWLPFAIAAVALLYSSVGHGGASGYLAALSFTTLGAAQISTTALVINLLVAGTSFFFFRQADHFDWRLTWPFLVGSIPLAVVGATLKSSERTYFVVVGIVLLLSGLRLLVPLRERKDAPRPPGISVAMACGACIGIVSGFVGVGGGIFLSPLMILMGWAEPKRTSATSAIFIVCNSMAGLAARATRVQELPPETWWLAAGALAGALGGSYLGSQIISSRGLKRVLGFVLLVAAFKLAFRTG